jgi:putative transposase
MSKRHKQKFSIPDRIIRSRKIYSDPNQCKIDELKIIIEKYRSGCKILLSDILNSLFLTGKIKNYYEGNNYPSAKKIISNSAMTQMANSQMTELAKSFISNIANDIRDLIAKSRLSEDLKHQLNAINVYQNWFRSDSISYKRVWFLDKNGIEVKCKPVKTDITYQAMQYARYFFYLVYNSRKTPDTSNIMMRLDSRAFHFTESKSDHFTHWVELVGPIKISKRNFKHILFPIKMYDRLERELKQNKRCNALLVEIEDNRVVFHIPIDVTESYKQSRDLYGKSSSGEIGMDFGMKNLFTTSTGDILGRNWIDRLNWYDKKLQNISRAVSSRDQRLANKTGLPYVSTLGDHANYQRLKKSLQGFIKTEINRILNSYVKTHNPKSLVVEELDFKGSKLSKLFNRLIGISGRQAINAKLQDLREKYGLDITEVNPAYTSVSCHKCHYTDKRNRKGLKIDCRWCGNQCNADFNASMNIRARRSSPIGHRYTKKANILNELHQQFISRYLETSNRSLKPGRYDATGDPRHGNTYSQFCI